MSQLTEEQLNKLHLSIVNGLIGPAQSPKKRPDISFKEGDHYVVVNDQAETAKIYNFAGKLLHKIPALARGQFSDGEFRRTNSDTIPGLYLAGQLYDDRKAPANRDTIPTLAAYGWLTFDLISCDNQEAFFYRAGLCAHGGGSLNGWPGAWAAKQRLYPTHGCIRFYNEDLEKILLPLYRKGKLYFGVFQEAA